MDVQMFVYKNSIGLALELVLEAVRQFVVTVKRKVQKAVMIITQFQTMDAQISVSLNLGIPVLELLQSVPLFVETT